MGDRASTDEVSRAGGVSAVTAPATEPPRGRLHPAAHAPTCWREFGTDLAHGVRLDQYYPNPQAVAAYHLSRHAEFGDYIPPSTSVVMERCFGAASTISSSLIAVMPGPAYEIRKIHPDGVASAPTSGFVPAVVCDEFRLRRRADGA